MKSGLLPYFLEYRVQLDGVFVRGGWAHSFGVSFFEGGVWERSEERETKNKTKTK